MARRTTKRWLVLAMVGALALASACDDDGGDGGDATSADTTMSTGGDTTQTAGDASTARDASTANDTGTVADASTASDTAVGDTGATDAGGDVAMDVTTGDTAVGDTSVADTTTADTSSDTTDAADMTMRTPTMEMEPNNGGTTTEYNDITTADLMQGAVDTAGDADIFQLDTVAGRIYTVTLTAPAGSLLDPNLTVIDDGRGGDPAGEDYVKIAVDEGTGVASLSFLAMGEEGYFLIVRDDRDVGGNAGEGSSQHTWTLTVDETDDPTPWLGAEIMFPATFQDQLATPGGLRLYPFTGTQGADIVVGLTASGDIDGRLFVFSEATNDWIVRNDDGPSAPDPLIDAFLPAGGNLLLVVENIVPTAASLSYSISASLP